MNKLTLFLCFTTGLLSQNAYPAAQPGLLQTIKTQQQTQLDQNIQAYEQIKKQTGWTDAEIISKISEGIAQMLIIVNDCKATGKLSAHTIKLAQEEALRNNPDLTQEQLNMLENILQQTNCQQVAILETQYIAPMRDLVTYIHSRPQ